MTFKINLSNKDGKTYKLELESEEIPGLKLGEKMPGNLLLADLADYDLEITGLSDFAGFTSMEDAEGIGLTKQLLTYGKGMHKRPKKEGKKKQTTPKPGGLRLRKTVRGNTISNDIVQINIKVLKEGAKKLSAVFSDQNKAPEPEAPKEEAAPEEKPAEETPVEKPAETPKEELKAETPKEETKEEKSEEKKE